MNTYTIYFELFGKKMKTTVQADSEIKAKDIIRYRIIFHKVEDVTKADDILDQIRDMFNMK